MNQQLWVVCHEDGGVETAPMDLESAQLQARVLNDRLYAKQDLWGIKRQSKYCVRGAFSTDRYN